MALSNELISQFAKMTNPKDETRQDPTLYGVIVEHDGTKYVKIDGSELLTPVTTFTDAKNDERVSVEIKNHSAIVTGNVSSPSARTDDVKDSATKITELELLYADTVRTDEFQAEVARIDGLVANDAVVKNRLTASEAAIDTLEADNVTINNTLTATDASIKKLQTEKLSAELAEATYAKISNLEATNATVTNLNATYSTFAQTTTEKLNAADASIVKLQTDKMNVSDANIKFANVDFSNIGQAAMEYLYSKSGLIENVVVSDGTITGVLAGVTIRGDTIEANTVVADKLVIQGEDGLYYKLNTDGATIGAEQTEFNSLNGQIIMAKSITATQISVDDLVAFDATIGGFSITDDAIFSNVKDSEGNTTRGTYLGADGQVNFGDADKFLKYYQDEDGTWRLVISADTILYTLDGKPRSISDLGAIGEYVKIDTYEGEPCIELGETDSDFKLRITNTRMLFTEGTNIVAHISNQSLHIKKAVIEEELQQGEFVWKARSNGNLGLIWKGVTS